MKKDQRDLLVQPVSVLEQSIAMLRTAIISGDFLPGEKLVEQELCRRMGISRPSLREALRRLEAERVVDFIPNRGTFVAKLGPEEVDQIHEAWTLLTCEVVYQFAKRATAAHVRELQARVVEIKALTKAGDTVGHVTATNAFFRVIVHGCGNTVYIEILRNLMYRIHFLRARSLLHERRQRACIAELDNIVAAVRDKNPREARLAVRRHIDAACEGAREISSQPAVA